MHIHERHGSENWGIGQLLKKLPILFAVSLLMGLPISLLNQSVAADTSVIVTHALGQTSISSPPQRVVTLFQGAADITLALGVTPVGTVESWLDKPIYPYLRQRLSNTTVIGLETQPNLEDIAKLRPDLIIASAFRNERIHDLLSYIAPTVAAKDIFSFRQNTRLIGSALGRQERAEALLNQFDHRITKDRKALQEKFRTRWPLTAAVLDFRSDHVRVYLANSFAGSILSELGFKVPPKLAQSRWSLMKLTNRESIPVIDADIFFVMLRTDNAIARRNYEDWSGHLLWKQLTAVKHRQVHLVDTVIWSLAGGIQSAYLMLDELEKKLLLPSGRE